jgi:hypothetical protein
MSNTTNTINYANTQPSPPANFSEAFWNVPEPAAIQAAATRNGGVNAETRLEVQAAIAECCPRKSQ